MPDETLCRKCAEHMARVENRSTAPHRLVVLLVLVPGGILMHFLSFVFVCAICFTFGGGYKSSSGMLVLGSVIHCIAMVAFATRLMRDPAERGFGFGILIGACLTGLLTANCNLGK